MQRPKPDGLLDDGSLSATLRRWIIEQARDSCVGHVGSALSIVEMLAVLWRDILRQPGTEDPDRDRFILAKGHAALALYAVLRNRGLIDDETFHTYCKDDTHLGAHPEVGIPGVEVATGSLGQGLSVGCGLALALREKASPARVYVLLSDAECNEGQVWEAIMFASHHKLSNLIALVDDNGMQALGRTSEILNLSPLATRWRAFGWHAVEVDGHDETALRAALSDPVPAGEPLVIVARTHLGQGVSFMEDRLEWHYRNLSTELAGRALAELEESA